MDGRERSLGIISESVERVKPGCALTLMTACVQAIMEHVGIITANINVWEW
jgi:hypothetical protein